jgi:acyl-CoA synthetase (AMP-forming)/AMP-acid ligase II
MLDHGNLTAMVGMITTHLTHRRRSLFAHPAALPVRDPGQRARRSPPAVARPSPVASPSTFFDTVEAVRPTSSAVPAIYAMLTAPRRLDPDTHRWFAIGASPMPAEVITLEERYGTTIVEGYGLSECACADHQPDRRATQARDRRRRCSARKSPARQRGRVTTEVGGGARAPTSCGGTSTSQRIRLYLGRWLAAHRRRRLLRCRRLPVPSTE